VADRQFARIRSLGDRAKRELLPNRELLETIGGQEARARRG
jgi:hypothetical protein